MSIKCGDFRVPEGQCVDLTKWPTRVKKVYKSKKTYHKRLDEQVEELSTLQRLHYASDRYSVLVIFQGMDAAGKDGAIRQVMSGVNPQGCEVFSFKQPSAEELQHDFLWRTTRRLPERGRIGIFNRSYYEEVLVVRVHPELLRSQSLPPGLRDPERIWSERYRSIVELEAHLYRNGTRIIKIFLHESKDEQRKRFLDRIDDPEKNWKLGPSDIEERKYWKDYMRAYEACLGATSTCLAPWYVVPADKKKNARLIVSQILLDTFNGLDMAYPKTTPKRRRELASIRSGLVKYRATRSPVCTFFPSGVTSSGSGPVNTSQLEARRASSSAYRWHAGCSSRLAGSREKASIQALRLSTEGTPCPSGT